MDFDGLTITIGCPGSGKSTWADKHLPATTLRLERDRFREALFGSRRAYHDSPLDHADRSHVITQAMGAAMTSWPTTSWAITDTALRHEAVEPFITYAMGHGYLTSSAPIRLMIFERSPEYLHTCNRIRPHAHRIPDEILDEMIAQFDDPAAWWRHTDYECHVIPFEKVGL